LTYNSFRAPLRQANNEEICFRGFVSYVVNPDAGFQG